MIQESQQTEPLTRVDVTSVHIYLPWSSGADQSYCVGIAFLN